MPLPILEFVGFGADRPFVGGTKRTGPVTIVGFGPLALTIPADTIIFPSPRPPPLVAGPNYGELGDSGGPSWTPMVNPTMSGMIIEARDQVRITVWAPDRCTASTFFINL